MDKKSILKKYTGKGGPTLQRIGNTVRNVVRNITKGNDPIPKETQKKVSFPSPKQADTIIAPTKSRIPYSDKLANPGPPNFNNIVVPSQRIPGSANQPRIIPASAAKKVDPPEFREKVPTASTGGAISKDVKDIDLPKIPALDRTPEKEAKAEREDYLKRKVKSII